MNLISLTEDAAFDVEIAGGKASTLAVLARDGYPVPEAWVIPAPVSSRLIAEPELAKSLVDEILEVLAGPLAVRSSAIAEDLDDASFAGMYVTTLSVEGPEQLLDAILDCVESANLARVRSYAASDTLEPPAILIQKMVNAQHAGVAFSVDPVTGEEMLLVSAVEGLGEALVDGTATPEDWRIDPGLLNAVPNSDAAVLEAAQAIEVARMAQRIEAHFGRPQDIEWAWGDQGLQLLQARPITVVPTEPIDRLEGTGWTKDLAHYPEPLTPFGFSLAGGPVEAVFSDAMLRPYGLIAKHIEYRMIGGESYIRIVPLFGPAETKGRSAPPRALLWLVSRIHPALRAANKRAAAAIAEGRLDEAFKRWESEWRPALESEATALRTVNLSELDDLGLVTHFEDLLGHLVNGAAIHFALFIPYAVALSELDQMCRDDLGWSTAQTMELLTGLSPASVQGREDLAGISQAVTGDPELAAAVQRSPHDPVAALEEVAPDIALQLSAWFETHGLRCFNYDAGSPTLAERPNLVTKMILDGIERRTDGAELRRTAEARARSGLDPALHEAFDTRLAVARRAYGNREENVIPTDNVPNGLMRRWVLEAGQRLVRRKALGRRGDVVYLEADEIIAALRGGDNPDLSTKIRRRKGEEAWVRAHPGPVIVGEPDEMPDVTALPGPMQRFNKALLWMVAQEYPSEGSTSSSESLVTGNPASPGVAQGPARIVMGEADFQKVRPGDILVSPITTPAWTMLFSSVAGVVTDGGGVLSHAAIVAREHGIPAVIGAPGATTRLVDGEMIAVDGTSGAVVRV